VQPLLVSTGLVALAEMGDKTQLLSLVLAARLRKPWAISFGVLVAALLNHSLAGELGYWLGGSIPREALVWITGLSFIGFGLWTLHPDALKDDPKLYKAGAFVTTVIAFFMAEMGDKTQFATIALAARFQAPVQVVLGTTLGMLLADVPAVWIGNKLAQRVPMKLVRIAAALLFVLMGTVTLLASMRDAS
jgi:putative Ca2+/H+ antiporter (TMEM165/GDT1 family)